MGQLQLHRLQRGIGEQHCERIAELDLQRPERIYALSSFCDTSCATAGLYRGGTRFLAHVPHWWKDW